MDARERELFMNKVVLNDKIIQELQAKRKKIYKFSVPKMILKNNKVDIKYSDATIKLLLDINQKIEMRILQIKKSYEEK